MLDGMCAVFLEQERQRQQKTYPNPDLIRAAYLMYTVDAAMSAASLGLQDRRYVEEHVYHDDDADNSGDLLHLQVRKRRSLVEVEEDGSEDGTDASDKKIAVAYLAAAAAAAEDAVDVDDLRDAQDPLDYLERMSIASTAETDHTVDKDGTTDVAPASSVSSSGRRPRRTTGTAVGVAHFHGTVGSSRNRQRRSIVKRLLTGSHFR
jgi:hypothetical protein